MYININKKFWRKYTSSINGNHLQSSANYYIRSRIENIINLVYICPLYLSFILLKHVMRKQLIRCFFTGGFHYLYRYNNHYY